MQKIMVTIDLSKIDKSRIEDYSFVTKDGETVKQKNYKMEVVELTSTKTLKEGDTWVLKKTHAVIEGLTKDERAQKVDATFIGDGLQFAEKPAGIPTPQESEIDDPSQIPF